MNPYSHLVLATTIGESLRPQSMEEYYLGAVVPDIRYLCGWRRRQTHLPDTDLVLFGERYPHLQSFVAGYRVHCAIDEFNLAGPWLQFPLRWLAQRLGRRFLPVEFESYYLTHQNEKVHVSEMSNQVLDELGVDRDVVREFSSAMNRFLADPALDKWILLAYELGIAASPGITKYLAQYEMLRRYSILRRLLLARLSIPMFENAMMCHLSRIVNNVG